MTFRSSSSRFIMAGVFAVLTASAVHQADARPGFRGGGSGAGISRGGFAGGAAAGAQGLRRQPGARSDQRPNGHGGQGAESLGQRSRPVNANTGNVSAGAFSSGNRNTGTFNRGSGNTGVVSQGNGNAVNARNGNTGVVNTGNVNNGNINSGNVAVGNNVDVDVNGGWAGTYGDAVVGAGAAYATGVAIGTTATASAATAAAVGSAYYALPAGCSPYTLYGYRYYTCGGTWYRQSSQGGSTVYVVVSDPR